MKLLLSFYLLITTCYASFCGKSGVPYSLEVLSTGAPVLGCAQPSCMAQPADDVDDSFFNTDGQGQTDGFFREGDRSRHGYLQTNKHRAVCEGTFNSLSCSKKNEWVGGFEYIDHPRQPLILQCCTFEGLRYSQDVGVTTISAGETVTGGEVIREGRQISFDVISNIRKVVDQEDHRRVSYEVTVRRMNCLPDPPEIETPYERGLPREILRVLGKASNGTANLGHHGHPHMEKEKHHQPDFGSSPKKIHPKHSAPRRITPQKHHQHKKLDRKENFVGSFGAPIFIPTDEETTVVPHPRFIETPSTTSPPPPTRPPQPKRPQQRRPLPPAPQPVMTGNRHPVQVDPTTPRSVPSPSPILGPSPNFRVPSPNTMAPFTFPLPIENPNNGAQLVHPNPTPAPSPTPSPTTAAPYTFPTLAPFHFPTFPQPAQNVFGLPFQPLQPLPQPQAFGVSQAHLNPLPPPSPMHFPLLFQHQNYNPFLPHNMSPLNQLPQQQQGVGAGGNFGAQQNTNNNNNILPNTNNNNNPFLHPNVNQNMNSPTNAVQQASTPAPYDIFHPQPFGTQPQQVNPIQIPQAPTYQPISMFGMPQQQNPLPTTSSVTGSNEPQLPPTNQNLGNLFQPPPFFSLGNAIQNFQHQG